MIKSIFKKGFTLIELLVVISMIGLLSSIVLASLGTARVKASDAAIKSDLRGIVSSAEIEYATLGYSYNKSNQAVSLNCTTTCTAANTILQNQRIQDAIKHIVANNGGQAVTVSIPADGKSYVISTPLSNGSGILSVDSATGNISSGSLVAPVLTVTKVLDNSNIPYANVSFTDTGNRGKAITYVIQMSTIPDDMYYTQIYTGNRTPSASSFSYQGGYYNYVTPGVTYYFRLRLNSGSLYSTYSTSVFTP